MLRKKVTLKLKLLMSLLLVASSPLFLFCVGCLAESEKSLDTESTDDFYAYYTRLDYEIPVEQALNYIPMEDEEDEDEEEEEEEDEEERWKGTGPITGRY